MTLPAWIAIFFLAERLFADLVRLLLGSSWRAKQSFARLCGDAVLFALVIWTIASFAPAQSPPVRAEPSIQFAAIEDRQ
jgi:hypothetical protein